MARERPDINMSGIQVAGAGGLGLLAVALVMTLYYPQAMWLLVIGSVGGTGVGAALVFYRRHHQVRGPSGDDPTILFRREPTSERSSRVPPIQDLQRQGVSGTIGRLEALRTCHERDGGSHLGGHATRSGVCRDQRRRRFPSLRIRAVSARSV
jgi:hypothetical protein